MFQSRLSRFGQMQAEDGKPMGLCHICCHLIKKCQKFRNRCLEADDILNQWKLSSTGVSVEMDFDKNVRRLTPELKCTPILFEELPLPPVPRRDTDPSDIAFKQEREVANDIDDNDIDIELKQETEVVNDIGDNDNDIDIEFKQEREGPKDIDEGANSIHKDASDIDEDIKYVSEEMETGNIAHIHNYPLLDDTYNIDNKLLIANITKYTDHNVQPIQNQEKSEEESELTSGPVHIEELIPPLVPSRVKQEREYAIDVHEDALDFHEYVNDIHENCNDIHKDANDGDIKNVCEGMHGENITQAQNNPCLDDTDFELLISNVKKESGPLESVKHVHHNVHPIQNHEKYKDSVSDYVKEYLTHTKIFHKYSHAPEKQRERKIKSKLKSDATGVYLGQVGICEAMPEKQYQCLECGKKFNQKYNLKIHLKIHTHVKPYQCSICEIGFHEKCHLKRHLRIHTGEQPYQCSVCEKRFNQKGNLKTHLKIHTSEQP